MNYDKQVETTQQMRGCLAGLRVVDFGQYIAGPATAMMLADYGAEVIHIDPPGGPVWNGHDANAVLMRGKRNLILNLKQPEDYAIARRLITSADIVIENFRPGVMERLGLDWETCQQWNPALIYCSLPGYSRSDELRRELSGWEGIISADGGLYSGRDFAGTEDWYRFNAMPLASVFAAAIACHSIAAALIVREKSGVGQCIESSLYDACFEVDSTRGVDRRVPMVPGGLEPPAICGKASMICRMMTQFPCKDGRYIQITPPPRGNVRLCRALFPEGWLTEGPPADAAETVRAVMAERTMREWEQFGQEQCGTGISCALTTREWMQEAHAQESRTVIPVDDPLLGQTLQPGAPALMLGSGDRAGEPRHLPDADREAILSEAERMPADGRDFDNQPPELPLKGIKVLDLCQIVAGPTCGRVLAEYGAEVIKINNPRLLDNFTALAGYETQFNGKTTVFLDLKNAQDRAVMEQLIREADVFHCNFAQSAYRSLHYSEEELLQRNPDLILSQVNLHSLGGGRDWMRGHEDLGEASTGMSLRYGGTLKPRTLPLLVLDHLTGQLGAFGVLLALYHRLRTGERQCVQVCLSRSSGLAQLPFMLDFDGKSWDEPAGEAMGYGPTDRIFRAKDAPFYLHASPEQLAAVEPLRAAMADADPESALEQAIAQRERKTWLDLLRAAGVAAVPCRSFKLETCGDDYAFARGIAKIEEHPGIGTLRTIHCPPRMSLTPPQPAYPSHQPGMDTEAFLAEFYSRHPELKQ